MSNKEILPISPIFFGCEPLGGTDWGQVNIDEIKEAARYAFSKGLSFDTADVYGLGQSELNLAAALGDQIDQATIISKFGHRFTTPEKGERAKISLDASPEWIEQAIQKSCERLHLKQIPVYLLHRLAPNTEVEPTIAKLAELKNENRVGQIGVSNLSIQELEAACKVAQIDVYQGELSLLKNEVRKEILPFCKANGIHFMAYGCLGQGLLTGKYSANTEFGNNDRRHRLEHFSTEAIEKLQPAFDELNRVAKAHRTTASAIAIAWTHQAGADSCIVGMKSKKHVDGALESKNVKLTDSEFEKLLNLFNPATVN